MRRGHRHYRVTLGVDGASVGRVVSANTRHSAVTLALHLERLEHPEAKRIVPASVRPTTELCQACIACDGDAIAAAL